MTHYEIEQWVDFSRGVASDADRPLMERHLAAGCTRCRRIVTLLQGVAAAARADTQAAPPASTVRMAKALYQPHKPERLIARLVYDSFRDPLPAGVRTQDRLTRHVLYVAGEYSLDVRLEEHGAPSSATLVGQIVKRDSPAASAGDVQVMLRSRTKTVAATSCNAFGEFHMAYRPGPALQLEVSLSPSGQVLEVPLGHVMESSTGTNRAKPSSPSR
jgi:hypothetical protein